MPKTNQLGGKKKKRGKNGIFETKNNKMVLATEGQFYGRVSKILGGGKFIVNCVLSDMVHINENTCILRGNMRKRIWVNLDDIVLVAGRDFGTLCDIIHKYSLEDHEFLYDNNYIPKKHTQSQDNIDFVDYNVSDIAIPEKEVATDNDDDEVDENKTQ
jgi:translation initiation factor 1A